MATCPRTQPAVPGRQRRTRGAAVALAALASAVLLLACARSGGSDGAADGFVAPLPTSGGALRGSWSTEGLTAPLAAASANASSGSGLAAVFAAGLVGTALLGASRARAQAVRRQATGTKLEDLNVGDTFDGKVSRIANIGIWINIGAEKEALWPKLQLPADSKKYKVGDTIPDLKIFELQAGSTPAERKIRVTQKETTSGMSVGSIMDGTITSKSKFGIFIDVGASKEVLCSTRGFAKPEAEYKEGDKVQVKILEVQGDRVSVTMKLDEEVGAPSGKAGGMALADLREGQVMSGTIASINTTLGVFINVGAERDALCRPNQLAKPLSEYVVGEKMEGLKIIAINLEKKTCEVSTRPLASDVKEGDKLEGTVLTISKFGVFFDAGLSTDVLAPFSFLAKPADEYMPGEVADLVVVKVQGSRVTVSSKSEAEISTSSVSNVIRGSKIGGTVKTIKDGFGVFVDIGAVKDALFRTQDTSQYKVGQELPDLIVTNVDSDKDQIEVSTPQALSERAAQMANMPEIASVGQMPVGTEISGTIVRITEFGIFLDVGAQRNALWPIQQMDEQEKESYKVGDVVSGLRVTESDPEKNRLAVSNKKTAADFEVGQEVEGIVRKNMPFGLFIDIGGARDALAPNSCLEKDAGDYTMGEKLEFTVIGTDISKNSVTVKQKGVDGGGAVDDGRLTLASLTIGQRLTGIVRSVKDYGAFVDIGVQVPKRDALLPASLLDKEDGEGPKTLDELKEGQEFQVYVSSIDTDKGRVTVSIPEPSPDARSAGTRQVNVKGPKATAGLGYMQQYPDVKWYAGTVGAKYIDEEPVPWVEWAEKYPGMIKFPDKEREVVNLAYANGFRGMSEFNRSSQKYFLPVPMHLRKADAGPPIIPPYSADEHAQPYEYGIKPEIHVKYRFPPMNDPNWIYRATRPEDFKEGDARFAGEPAAASSSD